MAAIQVLAGDFIKGRGHFYDNTFQLLTTDHSVIGETLKLTDIAEFEQASEDNVKRLGGTVGWGIAGVAALGGIGLLAGLIAGGNGKDITFVVKFKDGRKLLASTKSQTFRAIEAAMFDMPAQKRAPTFAVESVPTSVMQASNGMFHERATLELGASQAHNSTSESSTSFFGKLMKFTGYLIATGFFLFVALMVFVAIVNN